MSINTINAETESIPPVTDFSDTYSLHIQETLKLLLQETIDILKVNNNILDEMALRLHENKAINVNELIYFQKCLQK